MFADATDVTERKNLSQDEIISELRAAWTRDCSLQFTLILLNPSDEAETRMMAAECLEGVLREDKYADFVLDRMCMAPLPGEADLAGAIRFADSGKKKGPLYTLLSRLRNLQDDIGRCRSAWDSLPPSLLQSSEAKRAFESAAVWAGLFRRFAEGIHDPAKFDSALLQGLSDLRELPNNRQVLLSWTRTFRPQKEHRSALEVTGEESERIEVKKEYKSKVKKLAPHQAWENVTKQKEAIVDRIKRGDLQNARRFVDQLLQFQLKQGGPKFAVMSLCDLAQQAKDVLDHSLQLDLAKRAVEILPTDGWAASQLGDAYLCLDQYDGAAEAFKLAEQNGQPAYARTGRARILRGRGMLQESLEMYERTIEEFPSELSPWTGRAEVLRDLWRFEEALRVYEEIIDRFPSDKIPRCGRAAVLKDLGRLQEALEAYGSTIVQFPDDVVAYAGRADVLKEIGQLQNSMEAYSEAISKFPDEATPRTGQAGVLKEIGRLQDALVAYDDVIANFRRTEFAFCGRAEVFKEMNRLDDALSAYDEAIAQFPRTTVAHCGRAAVLERMGKLSDALQAYDQAVARFPREIVPWSGRAELLKHLGQLPDALEAYEKMLERNPHDRRVQHSKAAILVVMQRYDEAEALLPSGPAKTVSDWVAYHIRGMIQLRKGNIGAAVNIFKNGLDGNPWYAQMKYFRNALAIANLRRNSFAEATSKFGDDEEPLTDVLRIHAFGAWGRRAEARQAYSRLETSCPAPLVSLRDELANRYVTGSGAKHPDDWVFEEECKVILLRAA